MCFPISSYKLPKSIITVNGWHSRDPLTDIFTNRFNNTILLDGSESRPGSGRIVEYFWDLGDTRSEKEIKVTHSYTESFPIVFPLLRVKDENGFISDSFVEIDNSKNGRITQQSKGGSTPYILFLPIVAVAGVALMAFFLRKRKR